MEKQKFIDIIDAQQQYYDNRYQRYMNTLRISDYQYLQDNIDATNFAGNYIDPILEPVKLSRNDYVDNRQRFSIVSNVATINNLFSHASPESTAHDKEEPILICKREKKKVDIMTNVENIDDLLSIIEKHDLKEEEEYNIDLQALHKIKDELKQLQSMVGLASLKKQLLDQVLYFMQKLHQGSDADFMHTVLYGPPGTGKTEIAMLMGKMYSKIGVLKNETFRAVNRSDLIAGYLGQTALKTSKVIEECLGGCLFIDEAYSLANSFDKDSFSKECIDTLCESLSRHKGELMVIIAGYKEDMENTFFRANKGLSSRFIWRFHIEKYSYEELLQIFLMKISKNGWLVTIEQPTLKVWFQKHYPLFSNFGRDVELLFTYVKICHSRRIYGLTQESRKKLTMEDLEKGRQLFENNRSKPEVTNVSLLGLYV